MRVIRTLGDGEPERPPPFSLARALHQLAFAVGVGAISALIGFVLGYAIAGLWNHFECSSFVQAAEGCTYLRPHPLGRIGAWICALVGFLLDLIRRDQPPASSDSAPQ